MPSVSADALDDEALETDLITKLSRGRLDEIGDLVDAGDSGSLVMALASADARLRISSIGVLELQSLQRRAVREEGTTGPYAVWATALLAERLMLDGDYAAYVIATATLDATADDPLGRLPLVYGRARLQRVAAAVWLLTPIPEGLQSYRTQTEEAIRSLLRCGFVQEVAVTSGIAAALQVIFLRADPQENYARVLEARSIFDEDDRSLNAILLDYLVGVIAMHVGEIAAVREAADRIERSGVHHIRLQPFVHYARAWARLMDEGDTPEVIDAIDAALRGFLDDPRILQLWRQHIAHALANRGNPVAGRYARSVLQVPAFGPADRVDRAILSHRVALLEGRRVSLAELHELLGELTDLGRDRTAFGFALRLARDLSRAGEVGDATELHRWGLDHRDPRWELTRDERRLLEEPGDSPVPPLAGAGRAADAGGSCTLAVRVLGPNLQVELDGKEVLLGRKQSLLLIAMVLSHPSPVLVEDASELLWPGAPLSATRLNSVVHRLRDKLGASRGTVVRTGRLLRLDPARCTVDLWEHRRKLAASIPDVRQALRKVPGNIVTTELRNHDVLVAHRERFRTEWLRHARTLVAGGHVRPAELYDAAGRLGVDVAELDAS